MKRKRARYIVPVIYLIFAYIIYLTGDGFAAYFIAIAVIWFLAYPAWTRYRYKKHYQSFTNEHFKNYDKRNLSLTIDDKYIHTQNEECETKVALTAIQKIAELPTLFLIQINTAQTLILPKNQGIDTESIRLELKTIADKCTIPFHNHEDWKWK